MKTLITKAFVSALGVGVYVLGLAYFVSNANSWLGAHDTWMTPALVFTLFVISACITGSLVLLRPILMYLEGQKKDALKLFAYTVVCLIILAILFIVTNILILK